jgi:hypothetical protein
MPKQRKVFFIIAALLAFILIQHPQHAFAATASTPDWQNADCTDLNKSLQDAQTSRAQYIVQNNHQYWSYMPPIDLATYNCLAQIDSLMSRLQGISGLNVGTFVSAAFTAAVTSLIGQACNVVSGTLTGVENLVYSQINRFCVPLPNLNLHLGTPTFPAGPTCNGTPLLHLTPLPATTTSAPTLWQLWGRRPGAQSGTTP